MTEFLDASLRGLAGGALLDALAEQQRWDVLEVMWRAGDGPSALAAGRRLAASTNPQVVDVVASAIVEAVPGQPDAADIVQMLDASRCTKTMAERIFEHTPDDELRTPAPITRWLLRQPSDSIDTHAVELVGGPDSSRDLRDAAAARCSESPALRKRALAALTKLDRTEPARWVETVELLAQVVGTARVAGLTDLRRTLVDEYMAYRAIGEPGGFVELVLAAPQAVLDAIATADELPAEPTAGASQLVVRSAHASKDPDFRVALALSTATKHPQFWVTHHAEVVAPWGLTEWQRFFASVPTRTETGSNISFDQLMQLCPDDYVDPVAAVNAAVHLDLDAGAGSAVESAGAKLSRRIHAESADELATLDWPPPDDVRWPAFRTLARRAMPDDAVRATLVGSLMDMEVITPAAAHELVADGHRLGALAMIDDLDLGTEFVSTVVSANPDAAAEFSEPLASSTRIVLLRGLAPTSPEHAFAHVAKTWDELSEDDRDVVLELLEHHGTDQQSSLLDLIVADTSGTNRARRARAGLRWAQLVPEGTAFPPGISSLLQTSNPDLARTVATIASQVRPSDHQTLVALRDRWATADPGDPVRTAFRSALDAVDTFLAAKLAVLERGPLLEDGPTFVRALGVTAGPDGFAELTALVGPDARNDNIELRRAAAAALREYFSAHPQDSTTTMVDTLGRLATPDRGELDAEARKHLSAAFRSASLGDDAALAMLDPYIGDRHTMGDYLGAEKSAAVAALNGLASRRAQGAAGYSGLVQQLDVVVEQIARAGYLVIGPNDNMKQQIRSDPANASGKLPYQRVIDGLRQTLSVANMEVLHDLRSNKTEAHGADKLTESDVERAEDAFKEAVPALYAAIDVAWTTRPGLKAVDDAGSA